MNGRLWIRRPLVATLVLGLGFLGGLLSTRMAPPPVGAQVLPGLAVGQTFIVQDRAGRSRVLLTSLPDGRIGMALLDEAGRPRAAFGIEMDGKPGLAFVDEKGTPRAVFGLRLDGTPAFSMNDESGATRLELSVGVDGAPRLLLGDTQLP